MLYFGDTCSSRGMSGGAAGGSPSRSAGRPASTKKASAPPGEIAVQHPERLVFAVMDVQRRRKSGRHLRFEQPVRPVGHRRRGLHGNAVGQEPDGLALAWFNGHSSHDHHYLC
jgi:hypothetical protein